MMRGLDMKPHLLEDEDDFAAHVFAKIDRRQIEVAARVMSFSRRLAAVATLEQKEFRLGAGLHREALLGGHPDRPLEHRPRTARERCPVGIGDITDDASYPFRSRVAPGKNLKRAQVRLEVHVGLFDPYEALDRRAVEHDPAVQRFLELAIRYLDVLDDPEYVGELKPYELHFLAFGSLQNPRFGVVLRHSA